MISSRAARLVACLSVLGGLGGLVAPAASARAAALPVVTITSPVTGSFVEGTIAVTATGTVDTSGGDAAFSMALQVDGLPAGDQVCAAESAASCAAAFSVDSAALASGPHMLTVQLSTLDSVTATATVTVGAGTPGPSAMIRSPRDADSVYGGVNVDAVGYTWDRSVGSTSSMQLVVDGAVSGGSQTCVATVVGLNACNATLPTSAGVTAGPHKLQVRVQDGSSTVDSQPVTITVLLPSVVVSAPPTGSAAHGVISLTATGTAAGPDDSATSMVLIVDGNRDFARTLRCPDQTALTCTLTLTWDATSLTGTHTLAVGFITRRSGTISPAVPVTIYTYTRLHVYAGRVPGGPTGAVYGTVDGGDGHGLATPLPVTVTVTPAIGRPRTVQLTPDGGFRFTFLAGTNSRITAQVAATATNSAAVASTTLFVPATPHCTIPTRLGLRSPGTIVCTAAHLPKGTKVTLQYSAHHRWHTFVAAVSTGGRVSLPVHWDKRQVLWVRVVLAGNPVYGTTYGKAAGIKVG